jgi:hypothetical protein
MKASVIPCGPAVNESERRAVERLKSGLIGHPGDAEWLLLTNLTFSATHRLQSDEVDIVAFFTVTDPAAPGVIERVEDDEWDSTARVSFARSAVRAVQELHAASNGDEPLLHRNLTPRSILVRHDNSPILTGFEHARIPAEVTVASPPDAHDRDDTVAPEVRAHGRGAADRRSDVYGAYSCSVRAGCPTPTSAPRRLRRQPPSRSLTSRRRRVDRMPRRPTPRQPNPRILRRLLPKLPRPPRPSAP